MKGIITHWKFCKFFFAKCCEESKVH